MRCGALKGIVALMRRWHRGERFELPIDLAKVDFVSRDSSAVRYRAGNGEYVINVRPAKPDDADALAPHDRTRFALGLIAPTFVPGPPAFV